MEGAAIPIANPTMAIVIAFFPCSTIPELPAEVTIITAPITMKTNAKVTIIFCTADKIFPSKSSTVVYFNGLVKLTEPVETVTPPEVEQQFCPLEQSLLLESIVVVPVQADEEQVPPALAHLEVVTVEAGVVVDAFTQQYSPLGQFLPPLTAPPLLAQPTLLTHHPVSPSPQAPPEAASLMQHHPSEQRVLPLNILLLQPLQPFRQLDPLLALQTPALYFPQLPPMVPY
jgi:hypothetical protein